MEDETEPFLRIGELSRRVGVSEHLLRAWELRYGLMKPARSEGGYRLYTAADERQVRRMLAYIAQGLAAAQAAKAAKGESVGTGETVPLKPKIDLEVGYGLLRERLDNLNEPAAQVVLDRLLADYGVESVLGSILLPYLKEMGTRWVDKTLSVGQEHFASNIFRGRLAQLARGWGEGDGPNALLACPPEEVHEFALLIFGIMLHRHGWTIRYLGPNTPMTDIVDFTAKTRPDLVLLSATVPERLDPFVSQLREISDFTRLAISGRGASQSLADLCGATVVALDPITAAEEISQTLRKRA